MGLRAKLFITLLLLTAALVASMLGFVRWSFERGLLDFVERRTEARVSHLSEQLADYHAATGTWEGLRDRPRLWLALLRGRSPTALSRDTGDARNERFGGHAHDERPRSRRRARSRWLVDALEAAPGEWPPAGAMNRQQRDGRPVPLELRVMLLDALGGIVLGRADLLATASRRVIVAEGRTVGYLALLPGPGLAELGDLRFLERQRASFAVIAAVAVALCALLAAILASRLVRPIGRLQVTARRLADGDYAARSELRRGDELGQLANDLDALAETLGRNEQTRQQWVADIAHELRTPLSVMRAELEALADGVRPLNQQAVQSLQSDVTRLGRLVDDLHALTLTDLVGMRHRMVTTDVGAILDSDLATFRPRFEQAGLELVDLRSPHQALIISGDPDRLSQLFRNLLRNALRYTDAPGRVEVRADRDPSAPAPTVRIRIADSAPGVPDAALERLFERLFRVDPSRSRGTGGAGLGLAICRNIAKAHGGTITAGHAAAGGLEVTVRLPADGSSSACVGT